MSRSPAVSEAFWGRVVALAADLDSLTYYQLLGVEPNATSEEIKAAYYRRAPGVHPDRHTYERDRDRQRSLTRVYARFGEAFRVLRSPDLRPDYDEELAAGRTRLTLDAQTQRAAAAAGPDPRTPHARTLYDKGRSLLAAGDAKGALGQLRLAAQFERDSTAIAHALAEAERAAEPAVEPSVE